MLVIGIDEAGYGPPIGPLCHGYSAFRIENYAQTQAPDFWELLHPAVSRDGATGLAIGDSKTLYSTEKGFEALERGVRACIECAQGGGALARCDLNALLPFGDVEELARNPWFNAHYPRQCARAGNTDPTAFPRALAQAGVSIVAVGARAMSAREFNTQLQHRSDNKADVNWRVAAAELKRLLQLARPGESVVAHIDRQGGRKFYAPLVCEVLNCALVEIECEEPERSVYRLQQNSRAISVGFFVNGDALHLPIALASMCAKLARELIMLRLNAFFRQHLPQLKPTAGYYKDAQRFLEETKKLRAKLAIRDADFIRRR